RRPPGADVPGARRTSRRRGSEPGTPVARACADCQPEAIRVLSDLREGRAMAGTIKDEKIYKRVRESGASEQKAARIANAAAREGDRRSAVAAGRRDRTKTGP